MARPEPTFPGAYESEIRIRRWAANHGEFSSFFFFPDFVLQRPLERFPGCSTPLLARFLHDDRVVEPGPFWEADARPLIVLGARAPDGQGHGRIPYAAMAAPPMPDRFLAPTKPTFFCYFFFFFIFSFFFWFFFFPWGAFGAFRRPRRSVWEKCVFQGGSAILRRTSFGTWRAPRQTAAVEISLRLRRHGSCIRTTTLQKTPSSGFRRRAILVRQFLTSGKTSARPGGPGSLPHLLRMDFRGTALRCCATHCLPLMCGR